MRRDFWLDTIFGTAFIFILMWAVVNLFKYFSILDPVGDALGDMDMTDIRFSDPRLREDPVVNEDITIVNFGNLDRVGIAALVDILNKYNPKVIAIDALFDEYFPGEGWKDTVLMNSFQNAGNVVLVSRVDGYNQSSDVFDTVITAIPEFDQFTQRGQANLISYGTRTQEDFKVVRTFSPVLPVDEVGDELAFSLKATELYDPEEVDKFLKRKNETEIINYRGNVIDMRSDFGTMFFALDVNDVLSENFVPELIENKLIFMGYLGENFFDTSWDDKFFTPMNVQYAGRTNPDMFGVVIHANIAAMVLDEAYINQMNPILGILFGILICYLNVFLFTIIYRRLPRWYDGITKLIQLIEIIILFIVMVIIFSNYDFKLDITLAAAAIALAGDSLEVYNGVVKNLFSAEGRKQLFRVYKA